ncbi:MAG: threonylcarbamoyl-AMP synthase [Bacilli bacterium]|nr:threonylcarbamoyl-AMP synthase [Bacilli bacterium]
MKIYNYVDDLILKEIINVLNNDGLIIFPTDTVYGIACNAFSDKALHKLFKSKNRNYDKPINVLTDSISKINLVVENINNLEKELINKYFPGNLTIIFNKKDSVSDILTANKKTVGVRIPDNEIALKILSSYPNPLAVTSANISGSNTGTQIKDFIDDFKDKVDIIIDGGKLNNIPSTIVRVDNNKIIVLREGSLKIDNKGE